MNAFSLLIPIYLVVFLSATMVRESERCLCNKSSVLDSHTSLFFSLLSFLLKLRQVWRKKTAEKAGYTESGCILKISTSISVYHFLALSLNYFFAYSNFLQQLDGNVPVILTAYAFTPSQLYNNNGEAAYSWKQVKQFKILTCEHLKYQITRSCMTHTN